MIISSFIAQAQAQENSNKLTNPTKSSTRFTFKKNEQITTNDLLLNSRPQALFLEIRPQSKSIALYQEPKLQSPLVFELHPNQIIKIVLDIESYRDRAIAIQKGEGYWHKVDLFEHGIKTESLFLYETHDDFKAMKMSHYYLPIKRVDVEEYKTCSLYDTKLTKNDKNYSLKYLVSDPKQNGEKLWLPSEKFVRAIDRYYVSQMDCFPASYFTKDLSFTEKLVRQFDMLPEKSKVIKDSLNDEVFSSNQKK
ncbi:MAG: hypothetical protein H6625_00095 [Bdellovibrionaceae bacterium]|nr:hypothetical protein [Pseudobdellovibrionaceae bacterium]